MATNIDHKFKIILLGESGVGKTSLATIYTNMKSDTNQSVVNLTSKELAVKGNKVKLCIWETSSQKWFQKVTTNYYDGVLMVYDTTDMTTFNALSDWLAQLKERSGEAVVLVVGNKIDHPNSIAVPRKIAQKFARDEDLELVESSAKNADIVSEIFEHLTLRILQAKNLIPNEELNNESSIHRGQCNEHELIPEKLHHPVTPTILTIADEQNDEHKLSTAKFQQKDATSILTVQDRQSEEHKHSTEQSQQPGSTDSFNDTSHVTGETLPKSQLTVNGHLDTGSSAEVDSDEELELSFVWVSFLPPIVKLPPDITPLRVGRRRTSADSVLSLMTESKQTKMMLST